MYALPEHVIVHSPYFGSMTLQIVDIAKEILKLQQDINVGLLGEEREDQNWAHNDSNVRALPFTLKMAAFVTSFTLL